VSVDARRAYRVGQVAAAIGVHRDTVRGWCRSGKLPCMKTPGGHYRISAAIVDAMVAMMAAFAPPSA
jgi:excisionase family DNA binding protein